MNILKGLFGKKESSCCNVKIEEVRDVDDVKQNSKEETNKEE
ncbi:hypothetical protein ACQCT6_14065 [Cytobacillus gottheilii]|nr:hypothetical protein [Cytobacillus gottheilii]